MCVNFYFTFYVKIEQINYKKWYGLCDGLCNGICDVSVAISRLFDIFCGCEATREASR